jgi:EAL domain-containing protein (putative c-di-GMP-specific phosphodiesterase class I)
VIGLGRSLNMTTTAEGIETEEQFEIIRAAGVTLAQGYLFGKPCPAAELDLGSDLAITRRRRSGGGSEAA